MSRKTAHREPRKPVRLGAGRSVRASFDAAQTTPDNQRHWAYADALSADAEARPEVRQTLRRRSRYEVLNNSYAKGLVQMLANDTIGTGPRLQLLSDVDDINERIENDFNAWAREIDLAQKLRLMRMARCQDGETFAVIATNPAMRSAVKMKLDVVEADRIQGEPVVGKDGEEEVDGIRYDAYGNPVSYRMLKYHPGDMKNYFMDDFVMVPARFMLHSFVQYRPGLHRGVPELAAALPLFAQLRRYNLAVLSAAEAAADFAAVLQTDAPPDGESEAIEPLDTFPLERNMMVTMPAGWKLGQLESKHPTSNHHEFVKCILSEVARCVCSTYGVVAGDFSGFNYASGRLDNQIYQKAILVDRSRWENDVLDRVFDIWVREWSLATSTMLPADMSHEWFWDGFMHVDPTKEANAQTTRLQNLTTTLADEYARMGQDYVKKLRQIAKERRLMRDLGITQDNQQQPQQQKDGEEDAD